MSRQDGSVGNGRRSNGANSGDSREKTRETRRCIYVRKNNTDRVVSFIDGCENIFVSLTLATFEYIV